MGLTYISILKQGLVVEAKNLVYALQVGVLDDKVPVGVVMDIVEVVDGQLHPPILLVAKLDMPMHTDRAHMLGAPHQWPHLAKRIWPRQSQQRWWIVTTAANYQMVSMGMFCWLKWMLKALKWWTNYSMHLSDSGSVPGQAQLQWGHGVRVSL